MAESSGIHPLADMRSTAALALLGICGVGWGAMISQVIAPGVCLSAAGALATLWLYASDVRSDFSSRQGWKKISNIPKPIIVAFGVIAFEVAFPVWIYISLPAQQLAGEALKSNALTTSQPNIHLWIIWAVITVFLALLIVSFARERRYAKQEAQQSLEVSSNTAAESKEICEKQVALKTEQNEFSIVKDGIGPPIECGIANWERLYKVSADRTEVTCKFFPDTGSRRQHDALLLIVYANKYVLGRHDIHIAWAHRALEDMLRNAPGSPLSPVAKFMIAFPNTEQDYGIKLIADGYLTRHGLARGGYYTMTSEGESRGSYLTLDAIARA